MIRSVAKAPAITPAIRVNAAVICWPTTSPARAAARNAADAFGPAASSSLVSAPRIYRRAPIVAPSAICDRAPVGRRDHPADIHLLFPRLLASAAPLDHEAIEAL